MTRKVFTLPVETLLFAGHALRACAVSSVLEQKRWQPWFVGASRDDFLARLRALSPGSTIVPAKPAAGPPALQRSH